MVWHYRRMCPFVVNFGQPLQTPCWTGYGTGNWEVLCSNLGSDIGYTHEEFSWFYSVPPGNFMDITTFRARPPLTNRQLFIIHAFDVTCIGYWKHIPRWRHLLKCFWLTLWSAWVESCPSTCYPEWDILSSPRTFSFVAIHTGKYVDISDFCLLVHPELLLTVKVRLPCHTNEADTGVEQKYLQPY